MKTLGPRALYSYRSHPGGGAEARGTTGRPPRPVPVTSAGSGTDQQRPQLVFAQCMRVRRASTCPTRD